MTRTVTVRIALAINSAGEWVAYGFQDCKTWSEAMESFDMIDDEHRRWIVAEVPVPEVEPDVIFGSVESAK